MGRRPDVTPSVWLLLLTGKGCATFFWGNTHAGRAQWGGRGAMGNDLEVCFRWYAVRVDAGVRVFRRHGRRERERGRDISEI